MVSHPHSMPATEQVTNLLQSNDLRVYNGRCSGLAHGLPYPLVVRCRSSAANTDLTSTVLEVAMSWTKPEAEVVAVTMEVTAYVATL